jgi:predicted phosphoadenosine phosphosulfate sulfurtransferase
VKFIYKEFDGSVVVSNSGGKDSTVVLELAARASAELGYGPAKVQWLDQECEFQATVDYQRYIMNERDDIDFDWYQIPFRIFNATNHEYPWLNCWGEGEEWVREKEPNSIHENTFGSDRFADLLEKINQTKGRIAVLGGMRMEESPPRRVTLLSSPMYKWLTYSSGGLTDECYMFSPIYDWSYRDVWKAIFSNNWRYNTHYNTMFQHGVPPRKMRVSNYTHENALASLKYLQEAEPETWERASARLAGINAFGHVGTEKITNLPYMFNSWRDYFEYLTDNLLTTDEHRTMMRNVANRLNHGLPKLPEEHRYKILAGAVVGTDIYGTTIDTFIVAQKRKFGKEAIKNGI